MAAQSSDHGTRPRFHPNWEHDYADKPRWMRRAKQRDDLASLAFHLPLGDPRRQQAHARDPCGVKNAGRLQQGSGRRWLMPVMFREPGVSR